jgi:hypothetical protein
MRRIGIYIHSTCRIPGGLQRCENLSDTYHVNPSQFVASIL